MSRAIWGGAKPGISLQPLDHQIWKAAANNYIPIDIVNFPFLDGDVPRRPSYGVYISQLIRFARVCSHVDDFNTRNKYLTAKLLK